MKAQEAGRSVLLLFAVLCLPLLAAGATGSVKVACVGNSITYGYGIDGRETYSYPAQLQGMLGAGYEVANFGHSGATLLRRGHRPYVGLPEFRQAMDFAADIVVIHLGINDTDPRDWPHHRDHFISDYCALVDSFRHANPRARIIIARLTPISHRHHRFLSGTRDWRDEIQQAILCVARARQTEVVDFHAPLYHRPDLFPDGLHPNRRGAAIMARSVCQRITGNYGGLRLPPLYADGMVLQRDTPLCIRGTADAGERVKVQVAGQTVRSVTAADGHWQVTLRPLKAGGPHTLTVSTSRRTLTFRNVLAGEVWLCSGQSNMEYPLQSDPCPPALDSIRLFRLAPVCTTYDAEWDSLALARTNELRYLEPQGWHDATPQSAATFSAVACHFGRMLQDSLHVPVGLICNAVGGTPAESWIDRATLEHNFPAILDDWLHNDFIQDWCRTRAARNIALALKPGSGFPCAPSGESLQRHPFQPCYMYEAGIEPLAQYPVRGVIWYQGESNAHNKDAHEKLFPLLVDSWRRNWQQPDMPFLFVQLSSLDRPSWPWFRNSQRLLSQQIPHAAMAVCSDVGDSLDVHPRHKQPVGERLARLALADVYRHSWFLRHPSAACGPVLMHATNTRKGTQLEFSHADGLAASDGRPLRTFELADEYGIFHPAEARIDGQRILLSSPEVKEAKAVRYGWQPFTHANLVNAWRLPASTFLANVE